MSKHLVRYGTNAEQRYFLGDFRDNFDTITLNANMLAFTPAALSGFIVTAQKPFIIDPQTHAFQHDIENILRRSRQGDGEGPKARTFKSSFVLLAETYGDPVVRVIRDQRPISPEDFEAVDLKDFCKRVLDFQLNTVKERINEKEERKYIDFIAKESPQEIRPLEPAGIVPPYFFLERATIESWLKLNIALLKTAIEINSECKLSKKIFAQIVISQDILDDSGLRQKIVKAYNDLEVKDAELEILLWVDDFSEEERSSSQLKNFKEFILDLKNGNERNVINLYGGYFSLLLIKAGILNGVSHGLEYGESRSVIPVGGGIPMAKYYFAPLHKRIKFDDLVSITLKRGWEKGANNAEFAEQICSCRQCQDLEKFGESFPVTFQRGKKTITLYYPTSEAKDHSLRHYLYNKAREFSDLEKTDLDSFLKQLSQAHEAFKAISPENVSHLLVWESALTDTLKKTA